MEEQAVSNQVQQAPVNPASPKPGAEWYLAKSNHWMIPGIILVLFLLFGAIFALSLPSRKPISPPPKPLISPPPISPTSTPIVIPTTDPSITANWKTYTDPIFGASFRYPPNWSLDPGKYNAQRTYWSLSITDPSYADQNCQGDCPYFDITFITESNQNNLSLIDVISRDFKDLTGGRQEYSDLKIDDWIAPSGVKFKKVTGIAGSGAFYYLYTLHNNKIYTIFPGGGVNAVVDDENDLKTKKDLAITDQILSTFKFTPVSPTGGDQEDQVVCTQDVKECLDGSYVSRQPPNCEFAKCP